MVAITALKPGDLVYTTRSKGQVFEVKVLEVGEKTAFAMINNNPARQYGLNSVKAWTRTKPERKKTPRGVPI
jgi:hypothetical protein